MNTFLCLIAVVVADVADAAAERDNELLNALNILLVIARAACII